MPVTSTLVAFHVGIGPSLLNRLLVTSIPRPNLSSGFELCTIASSISVFAWPLKDFSTGRGFYPTVQVDGVIPSFLKFRLLDVVAMRKASPVVSGTRKRTSRLAVPMIPVVYAATNMRSACSLNTSWKVASVTHGTVLWVRILHRSRNCLRDSLLRCLACWSSEKWNCLVRTAPNL